MAAFTSYRDPVGELALMRHGNLHPCRLTDNAQEGTGRHPGNGVDEIAHAAAADLLVIGEGQMDRYVPRRIVKTCGIGETNRNKAFHVARPPTDDAAVDGGRGKRRRRPGLALHRDDVGMGGEENSVTIDRTGGGEKRGFVSGRRRETP
jgi:hypothetical protein